MRLIAIILSIILLTACGPHWQDTPRPHYHNMPYIPAQ